MGGQKLVFGYRRVSETASLVAAAALAALLLSGCSPYEYSNEVSALSTGVDQLSSAVTTGYANLTADQAAQLQLAMVDKKLPVTIAKSCFTVKATIDSPPCMLFTLPNHRPITDADQPQLNVVALTQAKVMPKLQPLSAYAHALAAITNAADVTAFDAASKRLSGSIGNLAKAADPAAPGASAIAPAVTNLVLWLVGEKLNQDRFDALHDGVIAADPYVQVIAIDIGDLLGTIARAREGILTVEAGELASGLGPRLTTAAYTDRLNQGTAVIAKLNGIRQANAADPATALAAAHTKLVAAVKDPSKDYSALLSAVGDFATQAKAVHDALTAPAR
jgi:outer membrane murein-binding lipoprotein Lpp